MDTGESTTPEGDPAPRVVSQPLPPEVPAPRAESAPGTDGDMTPDEPGAEWWRRSAEPLPAEVPAPRAEGEVAAGARGEGHLEDASEPRRWDGEQVRGELRDAWDTHGMEGVAAAHEIGAHIGDAIAAHLPDPHAAAAKHGLDIRWMRLKYNVPALLLSVLATWRGQSPAERMLRYVGHNGILAPVGWVFMAALVVGFLMLTPIGSALGSALAGLVSQLIAGSVRGARRAWSLPVVGYVLKLIVATIAWSFVIALVVLVGRSAIRFLTGV
ncbi:hypothetical protein JHN52_28295 [Streptomyces sp. MBT97]|uniref:hypothetical protein n=1 Tax=Streptomyces sp. MBT97 TaxID=2800411 RepID=UPI00190B8C2A|nr:hypothetical protein [Streptomyces sp. MBT97]MBK3636735.1 hypothetical protein [Streptomyces sp. MBT97]